MKIRIGSSFDIHQRTFERKLILGGIKISDNNGLVGHSDADVLIHVICESILGAMGLEDLGKHFPDTDDKYKNISSVILLKHVLKIMDENNYQIINIDSQLILDSPHLSEYKNLMKENLCKILKIEENQINIKATRSEKSITAIKNNKAVFAFATILLEEK